MDAQLRERTRRVLGWQDEPPPACPFFLIGAKVDNLRSSIERLIAMPEHARDFEYRKRALDALASRERIAAADLQELLEDWNPGGFFGRVKYPN